MTKAAVFLPLRIFEKGLEPPLCNGVWHLLVHWHQGLSVTKIQGSPLGGGPPHSRRSPPSPPPPPGKLCCWPQNYWISLDSPDVLLCTAILSPVPFSDWG